MEEKENIIFGTRAVQEAIEAGKEIQRILVLMKSNNELQNSLIQLAKRKNIALQYVPEEKLQRVAKDKNHQGAIAYISQITYFDLDEKASEILEKETKPLFLVLDRITDVRNFGAIARTAECMGVHAIVIPEKGSAQINADAIKTSAGALNIIPIIRVSHIKDALFYFKQSEIQIVCCTEKTETSLDEIALNKPTVIVMGSEENGISPGIMKITDFKVKVPMVGKIESLNVSVAAGMILYEVQRQWNNS